MNFNGKTVSRLLTIVAALALLIGATWAYFSDTATSTGNSFASGNFEINIKNEGAEAMPFNVSNMEPGSTATAYLTVANDGDIDMKWRAYISGGDGGALFSALRVKEVVIRPNDFDYTSLEEDGYTIAGPSNTTVVTSPIPFSDLLAQDNGVLVWDYDGATTEDPFRPDWAATYKITVEMDPAAGNEYIGTSWSGDLTIYATQESNTGW